MSTTFKELLGELPDYRDKLREMKELLLANLVMIGEIAAPTDGEDDRVRFIVDRLSECGVQSCSLDEEGNGVGIYPGDEDSPHILVVAHADTGFAGAVDHTVSVRTDRVTGPGVADNSLGLAALVSLPTVLETLGIRLKSSLLLMAATRSLGRGNLRGLSFFLKNNTIPIRAGLCLEGVQLGRLSIKSIGMVRGQISCSVPAEYDWTRFGTGGAIVTLNEVINRMVEIPLPRRPMTSIMLTSIQGGTTVNALATTADLNFEVRSESKDLVSRISQEVEDIVAEVAASSGAEVKLDVFSRRRPGGIASGHPLARQTRRIMRALEVDARLAPSTSEISAFIDRNIPAMTLGISQGTNLGEERETVMIEPIFTGLAQILGVILAIDRGHCDEHP